jgi:hypothetical protein
VAFSESRASSFCASPDRLVTASGKSELPASDCIQWLITLIARKKKIVPSG